MAGASHHHSAAAHVAAVIRLIACCCACVGQQLSWRKGCDGAFLPIHVHVHVWRHPSRLKPARNAVVHAVLS